MAAAGAMSAAASALVGLSVNDPIHETERERARERERESARARERESESERERERERGSHTYKHIIHALQSKKDDQSAQFLVEIANLWNTRLLSKTN